jgi:hypothetical protein
MHLVSCARPIEPLEDAPCSSLLAEMSSGSWTGHWSTTDEGYYARCRHSDGSEEWFRLFEEGIGTRATPSLGSLTIPPTPGGAAPNPARDTTRRHVMLLLARSSSARSILVGNARPKSR